MTINKHVLVHAKDGGNGYHGRCAHCNVALVTDLGYTSWDGLKCIDREISCESDLPDDIREYVRFRGFHVMRGVSPLTFTRAYEETTYTVEDLRKMVDDINKT